LPGYLVVSAFKHHLISKEHPTAQLKPLLRWYNGQLAKEFIKKYYKEAKETLENFCAIGLLNVKAGQYNGLNEYHLDQSLFPALREILSACPFSVPKKIQSVNDRLLISPVPLSYCPPFLNHFYFGDFDIIFRNPQSFKKSILMNPKSHSI